MRDKGLSLTKEEQEILREFHRTTRERRFADRIKAVLLYSEGYTKSEIERILLIERRTIGRYIKKYKNKGVESLLDDNYSGSEPYLSTHEIELLREELRRNIYLTSKSICEYVKNRFHKEYKPESMVKLLHRIGFNYKKTKQRPCKADRKKQETFVEEYTHLRQNLKEDEKVYFLDAVHPQHNSMSSYGWIEKGIEKEVLSNTGRSRININGVYSPCDNEILVRQDDTINAQSTIALYKTLEEKHPELSKIYVIRDNARYYGAAIVKDYLKHSKIEEIPLPSYSPNLNLIERLWKFFKKKILYSKYYASFLDFKKATDKFFAKDISKYQNELSSLMVEKFHLVSNT